MSRSDDEDSRRSLLSRLKSGLASERWIELGALSYLLTIPFGPTLPPLIRAGPLLVLFVGLALATLAPAGGAGRVSYRLVWPFALFAASTGLAIVASTQPDLSAERSRYAPVAFLFFFAAQHIAANPAALRRLGLALSTVFLLIGIDALWQLSTGASLLAGYESQDTRISGSLPHPNDLALIPVLMPLLMLAPMRHATGPRLLALTGSLLALAAVILSSSRTAWIGLATVALAWPWLGGNRRQLAQIIAAAAAFLALAFALDLADLRERVSSAAEWQSQGRFAVWSVAWRMFSEAPILGKGAHLFGEYYALYLSEVDLSPAFVREDRPIPWAHNLYLEFLAERGLVGFTAWAVFVVATVRCALRTPAAYPCGASLAAFLIMGLLDLTFFKDWVALAFCLVAGLAAQLSCRENVSSDATPSAS